jgi:hypothetical protein
MLLRSREADVCDPKMLSTNNTCRSSTLANVSDSIALRSMTVIDSVLKSCIDYELVGDNVRQLDHW